MHTRTGPTLTLLLPLLAAAGGCGGGKLGGGGAGDGGHAGMGATGGSMSGGGGGSAEPTIECARATACPTSCSASSAACLQMAGGAFPTQNVALTGQITSVIRQPWTWPYDCLGMRGPFASRPTERLLVQVTDAQGAAWDLSLLPDRVAETRFTTGDELAAYYYYEPLIPSGSQRLLTVSQGGALALFFADVRSPSFELGATGLTFTAGDMTCPYSVPDSSGCSAARYAVTVSDGNESKTAPCGNVVGGFETTALYEAGGQAPASCNPTVGFCDATSSFVASGVRQP